MVCVHLCVCMGVMHIGIDPKGMLGVLLYDFSLYFLNSAPAIQPGAKLAASMTVQSLSLFTVVLGSELCVFGHTWLFI